MYNYSSGTAQAVLDYAEPGARLVFWCGWHITRDGEERYSLKLRAFVKTFGWMARVDVEGALKEAEKAKSTSVYP